MVRPAAKVAAADVRSAGFSSRGGADMAAKSGSNIGYAEWAAGEMNMGDMSKEPSMEEILSSIKRIIAEEGDGAAQGAGRRDARAAAARRDAERDSHRKAVVAGLTQDIGDNAGPSYVEEVLELTDEMPRVGQGKSEDQPVSVRTDTAMPDDDMNDEEELELTDAMTDNRARKTSATAVPASGIVSVESEVAARSSLAALSSMIVKAQEPGDNTLEGLVREMLKPMLKDWLDSNLPTLVEGMVAKEIARITGRSL
jgi:cell pole-organizing protein PopZ